MIALPQLSVRSIVALGATLFLVLTVIGLLISIHGFSVKVPLIGTIGPEGWKPRALNAEAEVVELGKDLDAEIASHKQTKVNFKQAQEKAAEEQRQYVVRVQLRQREITREIETDYRARLDRLRTRYNRLLKQHQTGIAAASASGDVRLPQLSESASDLDGAPDCDKIFAERERATEYQCRAIAEQQAAQLTALIDWIERQEWGDFQRRAVEGD